MGGLGEKERSNSVGLEEEGLWEGFWEGFWEELWEEFWERFREGVGV